jgi:serine/threonine-protein kinase
MLHDGPLPPATAVAIAAQTCDGLAAAHAAGIVHRDIKPANLMVTDAGVVKICDFGIARLRSAAVDTSLTNLAPPLGSYKYMAPEQALGGSVDARTDLYALGCTLYAMLAGKAPFSGDPMQVLHQHQTQPPEPLHTTRPDVPPALDELVQWLLRKSPQERPAGAADVRARLAAAAEMPGGASTPMVRPAAVPDTAKVGFPAPSPAPRIDGPAVAVSPSPPNEDAAASTSRRRWLFAAASLIVLSAAVLATALVTARWRSAVDDAVVDVPASVATESPAPATQSSIAAPQSTGAALSEDKTAVTPSRTIAAPPARRSSSAPPVDPIVGLRLSIRRQVDAGYLNPTKAPDLYKKVDEIAHAIGVDNTDEAGKKIQDLRQRLSGLLDSGTLTAGGYDTLTSDVDKLAASLP